MHTIDMTQELYHLDRPLSLNPIRKLIEDSGFSLDEIVVFFDFDQTLTQTERIPIMNPDGTQMRTKAGVLATQSKGSIRGGDATRSFLNYLNDNGIKWYVNTARGAGGVSAVAQSMVNFKIPFSPIMIKPDQQQCLSPKLGFMGESVKYKESEIGICNNVVSAGYDKDVSSDYVMSLLPVKPKLLIFVDDNATNILTLYNYIKYKNPELSYKGVIYEPFLSAEEDHESSMATLRSEGMPPIQEITAEYGASGGRRRNRKSRKNRKNRKQRKSRSQRN
jgi:hypothetical protein